MNPKRIALLGSTGSIGTQTLDVVERLRGRIEVIALAAGKNWELLAEQSARLKPAAVAIANEESASLLRNNLGAAVDIYTGPDSLEAIATRDDVDLVVVAVAGAVGIRATVAALRAQKDVAIATKEVLVAAGSVVTRAARDSGAHVLPIDSEHAAVRQCLSGHTLADVDRIWLTASGGPFRTWTAQRIAAASVQDALNHPTWRMGDKITVDSATLMNKGLEIIEAKWLFGIEIDRVDVVVHPQSRVHALVRFRDGSLIAQLALPDMRLPIQSALLYPEIVDSGLPKLEPADLCTLDFEPPDLSRFACLGLARKAGEVGHTMPAVLNAANEAAVALFLDGKIAFPQIATVVEQAMAAHRIQTDPTLEEILQADTEARRYVQCRFAQD